jgi:N-methylhydantoinase A
MQGNGGTISSTLIAKSAVNTVMSGPASGVMAAAYTGRASGHPNLITYDMGGTSTDVGLIENAVPTCRASSSWNTPCRSTCRWSTCTRSARAAARSPRSMPRACCGRARRARARGPGPDLLRPAAERSPTITDANLVLGRLNPRALLGVDHPVTSIRCAA